MDRRTILVTGGAGYVGSALVPKLVARGYPVKVIDWYIYGEHVFDRTQNRKNPIQIKGDIRDASLLKKELRDVESIIHLACISNDPSYDLDPAFGKSVNYDATCLLVDLAKKMGVKRFIYASTSSVYGVKRDREVTEDKSLEPLTDYSKYKALSEKYILSRQSPRFTVVVLRPATVCGYSPRLRLDLTVNILTISALVKKKIIVFGGEQKRPNIHIDDMVEAYLRILECDDGQIAGKIYNVGYQNYTIRHLAEMVKATLQDPHIQIEIRPTHDNRSYHVSSGKIERELGFRAKKTVEEAILDLQRAYRDGKIPAPFTTLRYYNIKTMQNVARPGDFLRNTHE